MECIESTQDTFILMRHAIQACRDVEQYKLLLCDCLECIVANGGFAYTTCGEQIW